VIKGFEAARRIFDLDALWREAAGLDPATPAKAQIGLLLEISTALRGRAFWLAKHGADGVQDLIDAYAEPVKALCAAGSDILSDHDRQAVEAKAAALIELGAPEALARRVAALRGQGMSIEIADLAREAEWPVKAAARLFHRLGAAFGLDRLLAAATGMQPADGYERLALRGLLLELVAEQTAMARAAMASADGPAGGATMRAADATVKRWAETRQQAADRARKTLEGIEAEASGWSFAKLSLATAALREVRSAG